MYINSMIIILDGITYNVKYKKSNIGNYMRREVTLLHNSKKIGRFVIEGISNHSNHFNSGNPCSMSIGIDDEKYKNDEKYKKKGLSPIMIKYMIDNIKRDYPNIRPDQYLYIDADASGGFWDSIGMEEHNNEEGKGYEKRISFENLQKYVDNQLNKPKYKNMIPKSLIFNKPKKSLMRTRSRRSLSPSRSPKSLSRNRSRSPKSYKRHSSIRSPSYTRKKIVNI